MQRYIVALSLSIILMASGCSRTGPWSLARGDESGVWSSSRLDYLVQRQETEQSFKEADQIRAEKERLAQSQSQPSPGILSDAQPLDPSEMVDSSNRTKLIRMVSKPKSATHVGSSQNNQAFRPDLTKQQPLHPKANSVEAEPPGNVVAHPLQPGSIGNSDEVVTIQQLPPMMMAQPLKRKHLPTMLAPKAQQDSSPIATTGQRSFDEVQQVGWEQEVQEEEQETSNPDAVVQDASTPEPDEFTNEDFYVAGWCQNEQCQEQCSCSDAKISAQVDSQPPFILPAQFQVEDGPQTELPPRLNLELKPLRDVPLRVASSDPPLPAPGQNSVKATPLPNLSGGAETAANGLVKPASAGGGPERVSHSDFRRADTPLPTWQKHLSDAIETIEYQVGTTRDMTERKQLQGKLELLRLLPSELDEEQQQYMAALTDLLQTSTDSAPTDIYETGQTLVRLRDAIAYLETIASMKVVNANFCTKVSGFGQFEVMENRILEAGQTVLIYCEIENHSSQSKLVGEQTMASTRLAGSCIVYDENQRVVQQAEFPVVEDLAQRRRRDFYMHIPFVVGDLPAGKYRYQLMIDDIGGGKSASLEPAMEFEVR